MKRQAWFVAGTVGLLVNVLVMAASSGQERGGGAFNGLGMNLGNLSRLSNAQTRSISPENFTGEKGQGGMATEGTNAGAARDLGRGWKVSPSVDIAPGKTFTLADIQGSGAIQQIWMTPTGDWRKSILRMLLGRPGAAVGRMPGGRFLLHGLGQVRPALVAGRVRQSGQRLQLLLGDALPQAAAASR